MGKVREFSSFVQLRKISRKEYLAIHLFSKLSVEDRIRILKLCEEQNLKVQDFMFYSIIKKSRNGFKVHEKKYMGSKEPQYFNICMINKNDLDKKHVDKYYVGRIGEETAKSIAKALIREIGK